VIKHPLFKVCPFLKAQRGQAGHGYDCAALGCDFHKNLTVHGAPVLRCKQLLDS
jgi:hypothetical protein